MYILKMRKSGTKKRREAEALLDRTSNKTVLHEVAICITCVKCIAVDDFNVMGSEHEVI